MTRNSRTSRRRWLGARVAVAAVAGVTVPLFMQLEVSAAANLSSVILQNPAPGFVAAAPGAYNGPITPSNLTLVFGTDDAAAAAQYADAFTSGEVTGFIRLWARQPNNGDAVAISAFEFEHSAPEDGFISSLDTALQGRAGATFPVPGVANASGFEVHTSVSGTPLVEYLVFFVKGDTAYQVVVGSEVGDLTATDAVAIATTQAASAPDTPALSSPVSWESRAGEVYGAVALVILMLGALVILLRRKRSRQGQPAGTRTPAPAGQPSPSPGHRASMSSGTAAFTITYPPAPAGDQETGWAFVGDGRQVQWYWDGSAWTGRKMLTPAGWVER